ncbi:hypothetical protein ACLKA6_005883 [Drosophila palustris]
MKTSHHSHASDFVVDYAVVAGSGSGPERRLFYSQSQSQHHQRQRQSIYAAAVDVDVDIKPTIEQANNIGISCDLKSVVYLDTGTQQPVSAV